MHTFVLGAQVILPDTLTDFIVEHEASLTWKVEAVVIPGSRFDVTGALMRRISDLLQRDKIAVAGDREEFTLGDPIKVTQGVYEFWFTWRIINGDGELDVVEMFRGGEEAGEQRLYIAGIKTDEEIARRIRDEVRHTRQSLDIEDERLTIEDPWHGLFKIIVTVEKSG